MASDFQAQIDRLRHKLAIVFARHNAVIAQRDEALKRIAELELELKAAHNDVEKMRRETDYMRAASALIPASGHIEESRAMIRSLVRDVNRCINDLTQ